MISSMAVSLVNKSSSKIRYTKWGTHVVKVENGKLVSELYNNATLRLVRRIHSPSENAFKTEYFDFSKGQTTKPVITEICEKGKSNAFVHRWTNMAGDVLAFFTLKNTKGINKPYIRSHSRPLFVNDDKAAEGYLRSLHYYGEGKPVPFSNAYRLFKNSNLTNENPNAFYAIDRVLTKNSSEYEIGVMTDPFDFLPRLYRLAMRHLGK